MQNRRDEENDKGKGQTKKGNEVMDYIRHIIWHKHSLFLDK